MQEILGGYTAVELRDGSVGNLEVARQYYRDFERFSTERPDDFKSFCAAVMADPYTPFTEAQKLVLVDAGLAWRPDLHSSEAILKRPQAEIVNFVQISVEERKPGYLAAFFSAHPRTEYKLVSPFRRAAAGSPDVVPERHKKSVILDWIGSDTRDYPGYQLLPEGRAAPKKYMQPNTNPIVF